MALQSIDAVKVSDRRPSVNDKRCRGRISLVSVNSRDSLSQLHLRMNLEWVVLYSAQSALLEQSDGRVCPYPLAGLAMFLFARDFIPVSGHAGTADAPCRCDGALTEPGRLHHLRCSRTVRCV